MSDVQSRGDSKLTLRPLLSEDRFEAIAAHGELLLEDFHFLLDFDPENDWDQYLQNLDEQSLGTNLMQGQVPATFLVAVIGSRISARVSIRHCLNEYLNGTGGGHIGYAVRPEFRRQGIATDVLKRSLNIAAELGISRALLTCDAENISSRRVIEKNGGIFENSAIHNRDGRLKHRFWIETVQD